MSADARERLRRAVEARGWRVAADPLARLRGWLGARRPPAADSGVCLLPCRAVHTCFMRFPIDLVFLARDGTVLRRLDRLGPWRVAVEPRAFAALELPAGAAARAGLEPGVRLTPPAGNERSPDPIPPAASRSRPTMEPR